MENAAKQYICPMEIDIKEIATVSMILFAVIDIIGTLPILLDLKSKVGEISSMKVTLVSGAIMLSFMFVGEKILNLIGIDVHSFAIAGSFILFIIGMEMILGVRFFKEESGNTASIVPIAFPLIAGTGTLTTLLSMMSEYRLESIFIGIFLNLLIIYVVLRNMYRLEKLLGTGGINILRKVFGIIMLAIAIKLFTANAGITLGR